MRSILRLAALLLLLMARAGAAETPEYVGTALCGDCHREALEAWRGSDHDLAWTLPAEGHLLGDFDGASFTKNGITSRMTHEADQYLFETEGPDGAMTRYPVVGVVGIRPLQQYLLETEPGRQQVPDISWDAETGRWYDLYPELDAPAGDGLHWTGPYKSWNARCAECHATGYEKRYDPATRSYHSRQAEIGVGCEACHGPGSQHVAWAQGYAAGAREQARSQLDLGPQDMGLTADLRAPEAMMQQCAGCHSRREALGDGNPLPGTPYHDAYRLSLLTDGLYHADGQIDAEVYVYGSFLQSKMYAKGVSCTNCHDPHAARVKAEDNSVCTQCHSPAGNPEFPSLPLQEFDSPSHHFHAEGSPGAQCRSCHMPEKVYMGVDGRRDHSFRIPRPDLDRETGAPDTCTGCHSDRTPDWAAAEIARRFPASTHRGPHFGQVFAAARRGMGSQDAALADIVEHDGMPGIVRASALDLLGRAPDPALARRLLPRLADPDPLVRAAAVPVMAALPVEERGPALSPLLADPARSVRLAAARAFLSIPMTSASGAERGALSAALRDWQQSLVTKADFPEAQMILAGIGLTLRNFDAALAAFGEAVQLDPQLVQGWQMIGRIRAALGDVAGARAAYDAGLRHNPGDLDLIVLRGQLP